MGLFGKKEGEPPEEEMEPVGGDSWRDYAKRGGELMDGGDIPGAIDHWCEAVDRFDEDRAKYLEKFCDDVVRRTVACAADRAAEGEESLTNLVADVERELRVKHAGLTDRSLSDDVYRGLAEMVPKARTADELTMLYSAASYAVMGFMRYAPDARHIKKRCADAAEAGQEAARIALDMRGERKRNSRIKPKIAAEYLLSFSRMFSAYAEALEERMGGRTAEDLDALASKWGEGGPDRYFQIDGVLRMAYKYAVAGRLGRSSLGKRMSEAVGRYADDCMAGVDPMEAEKALRGGGGRRKPRMTRKMRRAEGDNHGDVREAADCEETG